jgi:hypothetical protein
VNRAPARASAVGAGTEDEETNAPPAWSLRFIANCMGRLILQARALEVEMYSREVISTNSLLDRNHETLLKLLIHRRSKVRLTLPNARLRTTSQSQPVE